MVGKPPPRGYFPPQRAIYSLKRGKLRASWHKMNLYNIAEQKPEFFSSRKYFEQKWRAKSMTRAYHGIQVRERKWKTMFQTRMPAVVGMDPRQLAADDGSRWAMGRGSGFQSMPEYAKEEQDEKGKDEDKETFNNESGFEEGNDLVAKDGGSEVMANKITGTMANADAEYGATIGYEPGKVVQSTGEIVHNHVPLERTPFMQMLYAPIERRLDSAIHRALFASSIRQARQFVLHGGVKVNGKKMKYSGYLLNPGDLFQVDPDLVLYATGAPKDRPIERRAGRKAKGLVASHAKVLRETPAAAEESEQSEEVAETAKLPNDTKAMLEETSDQTSSSLVAPSDAEHAASPPKAETSNAPHKISIPHESLIDIARSLYTQPKAPILTPAQRIEYRQFHRHLQTVIVGSDKEAWQAKTIEEKVDELAEQLTMHAPAKISIKPKVIKGIPTGPAKGKYAEKANTPQLSAQDKKILRAVLLTLELNPVDDVKGYATPWRPRDYMSPFAFIPRFLEVNQKICAAVYIRHPVARPGQTEVPSPFNYDTHQLAFNWYVRQR
ncbi:MAG: mitochondrial 37S ribosomal protein nam9 [Vezdaea aestivalis]|nr:MAG: mitochondrial 37S ribosomal protein nam9 [Vezdaea aestivalis]